ncbi:hypothetical protein D3C84_743990 [compost metagenome]
MRPSVSVTWVPTSSLSWRMVSLRWSSSSLGVPPELLTSLIFLLYAATVDASLLTWSAIEPS